jgi:hypothetical protein
MTYELPAWATDPQAATPPLDEYLAAEENDGNIFWAIGCGHHQNLLDAAVEQLDEARDELKSLRAFAVEGHIEDDDHPGRCLCGEAWICSKWTEAVTHDFIEREAQEMADAIRRVHNLHLQRSTFGDPYCAYDNEDWPCATIRAVVGEEGA